MKSGKGKGFAKTARYVKTKVLKIRSYNTVSCQKSVIQDIADKTIKRRNMTIQIFHLRKSIQIAYPVRISPILVF